MKKEERWPLTAAKEAYLSSPNRQRFFHYNLPWPIFPNVLSLFMMHWWASHQLGGKIRKLIELPFRISVLDGNVLAFYVATLAQSQANCLGTGGLTSWIGI